MWKTRQKHQRLIEDETLLFDLFRDYTHNYGIVYPNNYRIGMSNLGVHFLYKTLNSRGDSNGERFFLEDSDEEVVSLESNRYLNEFEVIFFSLTYELDYLNVIKLLKKANLEIFGDQRTQLFPILFGGGAALTINPAPLLKVFDFIFAGNADLQINRIIDIINKKDYSTKTELWNKLKSIPGIIPGEHIARVKQFKINRDVPDEPVHSAIITPHTELKNMFLMEIARGCPYNCSFCSVSNIYGRFRKFKLDKVIQVLTRNREKIEKVGLISSAVLEHQQIKEIIEFCLEHKLQVNTSSLRLDLLNKDMLRLIKKTGSQTLTVALESGDEKLRKACGKQLTDTEIIEKVSTAVNEGFKSIKFYVILGLPGETDTAIGNSIKFFSELRNKLGSVSVKLRVSLNPFIPKPETAWSGKKFMGIEVIKKRFKILNRNLKKQGYSLKLENPVEAELQYLIANGDENIIHPMEENYDKSFKHIISKVRNT